MKRYLKWIPLLFVIISAIILYFTSWRNADADVIRHGGTDSTQFNVHLGGHIMTTEIFRFVDTQLGIACYIIPDNEHPDQIACAPIPLGKMPAERKEQ